MVHFAGSALVPDSVGRSPQVLPNNSAVGASLIQACLAGGVKRFVFSSTAAVYGIPAAVPVGEDAPPAPINPYGTSKLVVEWMLRDTAAAHAGFRYAALRYFNVAGADPHGRAGQSSRRATHLIKVASEAAVGVRPGVTVFGTDYDTPDGTCIRDYIHVTDLADAHVAVLRDLEGRGRQPGAQLRLRPGVLRARRASRRWSAKPGSRSMSGKVRAAPAIRQPWSPTCPGWARPSGGQRAMTTSGSPSAPPSPGRRSSPGHGLGSDRDRRRER